MNFSSSLNIGLHLAEPTTLSSSDPTAFWDSKLLFDLIRQFFWRANHRDMYYRSNSYIGIEQNYAKISHEFRCGDIKIQFRKVPVCYIVQLFRPSRATEYFEYLYTIQTQNHRFRQIFLTDSLQLLNRNIIIFHKYRSYHHKYDIYVTRDNFTLVHIFCLILCLQTYVMKGKHRLL